MSGTSLKADPTLKDLQAYIAEMVVQRGFSEADTAKNSMYLMEELGKLARAARKKAGLKIASDTASADLEDEAADVFIIFLSLCNFLDIDLEKVLRQKEAKNNQRTWA